MVTVANTCPPTYYGLSTDEKPVRNVQNGAAFIELDTDTLYFFDGAAQSWSEWGDS